MRKYSIFKLLAGLACGSAIIGSPTSAQASPILLMDTQITASLMAYVSSGYCIGYTYDLNGNRLTQTGLNFGSSGATWGSVSYGCYIWTL